MRKATRQEEESADCHPSPNISPEPGKDASAVLELGLTVSELCMLEIVVNNTVQLLRKCSNFNTAQILHVLSILCDKAIGSISI